MRYLGGAIGMILFVVGLTVGLQMHSARRTCFKAGQRLKLRRPRGQTSSRSGCPAARQPGSRSASQDYVARIYRLQDVVATKADCLAMLVAHAWYAYFVGMLVLVARIVILLVC